MLVLLQSYLGTCHATVLCIYVQCTPCLHKRILSVQVECLNQSANTLQSVKNLFWYGRLPRLIYAPKSLTFILQFSVLQPVLSRVSDLAMAALYSCTCFQSVDDSAEAEANYERKASGRCARLGALFHSADLHTCAERARAVKASPAETCFVWRAEKLQSFDHAWTLVSQDDRPIGSKLKDLNQRLQNWRTQRAVPAHAVGKGTRSGRVGADWTEKPSGRSAAVAVEQRRLAAQKVAHGETDRCEVGRWRRPQPDWQQHENGAWMRAVWCGSC